MKWKLIYAYSEHVVIIIIVIGVYSSGVVIPCFKCLLLCRRIAGGQSGGHIEFFTGADRIPSLRFIHHDATQLC